MKFTLLKKRKLLLRLMDRHSVATKYVESALETVIASIRAKHGVTEQQRTDARPAHHADPNVSNAVKALREAMNGNPPPGYRAAAGKVESEAAKARVRRAGAAVPAGSGVPASFSPIPERVWRPRTRAWIFVADSERRSRSFRPSWPR